MNYRTMINQGRVVKGKEFFKIKPKTKCLSKSSGAWDKAPSYDVKQDNLEANFWSNVESEDPCVFY